jgi:hypothetical protein
LTPFSMGVLVMVMLLLRSRPEADLVRLQRRGAAL